VNKYEVHQTSTFKQWLTKLKDRQVMKAVALRLTRVINGNLCDVKPVGGHVSEIRIFVGKGYRLYFTIKKIKIIVLLCGGDKSSQSRDVALAQQILNDLEE
jgi:putative addiction module killer protein